MHKNHGEVEFIVMPLVQPNADGKEIDIDQIKQIALSTLAEYPPEDRCLAWLVLSGLYPKNPNEWSAKKADLIKNYWMFVKEFGLENWEKEIVPEHVLPESINVPNQSLMAQIHCDIVRTGRHILFFPPESEPKPGEKDPLAPFQGYMRRIERVLYVFGCLNGSLSYTQGFNELASPLYFVMLRSTALFRNNNDVIEALTFSMLQHLITSTPIHELYTTQDKSSIILHKLGEFLPLIKKHLPNVYKILDSLKIHPALYCYRWFNLLFAQEYDMPALLLIWDTLFAHIDEIMKWAFYIGLAQLKLIERNLSPTDFSTTVCALQNLQINDPITLLKWASHYYELDRRKKDTAGDFLKTLFNF